MAAKDDKEKKDPKDAAPSADKDKGAAPAPAEDAAAPAGAGSLVKALLPAVLAIVVAPALSFAVAEFVLLPRLQKRLAAVAPASGAHAPAPAAEGEGEGAPAEESSAKGKEGGKEGKEGKEGAGPSTYEFSNVVVNLAGTMGTRYLKTSFIVTGAQGKSIRSAFEGNKAKLTDITLNVLSSLTLSDLEEPGSKNVLREKLVAAYNQALGKRLVDQVYFSDFVIQ
jgi:flagellar protein FliL